MRINCILICFLLPAIFHFFGPAQAVVLATGKNISIFSILLFGMILLFRIICLRFKCDFRLVLFIHLCLNLTIFFLGALTRIYVFSRVGMDLTPFFPVVLAVGGGEALPEQSPPHPSGGAGEDSFGINVLLESFSKTSTGSPGTSVNKPEGPADNPVTPPGPSFQPPRVPYQPDEVIGGDSVDAIARRLLAKYPDPSYADVLREKANAVELFEVKREIYHRMAALDPTGDWLGRGTRALENARAHARMGEPSLESLLTQLDDLQRGGERSATFWKLKAKVPLKIFAPPEHSSTS